MRQLGYHRTRPFFQTISQSPEGFTLSMSAGFRRSPLIVCVATLVLSSLAAAGCHRKEAAAPPVATPSVTLNHDKAPLGSPLEITYRFVVANDAHFAEDYRVMMHVVDTDDELMWTDDHNPPTPTTSWKPGQVVEYTRTVFVPVYPYVGEASIQLGLYSTSTQKRLPLVGEDVGQRAYKVSRLQLQPQTENVFTMFKEGWHPAEVAEKNAQVEWQWTKKNATLAFKNPRKDVLFYLDLDNPGSVFQESQHLQVSLNGKVVDEFTLTPKQQVLRRVKLTADELGTADMAELQISVDKTFIPAALGAGNSKDPRELGVRVFHAFVDAR
jgi:hypothetical protein